MANKTFTQEIIDLLKDITIAALKALKMFFTDLSGFRNRLIVFVCLLGLILVISERAQTGAQVSVLGIIGVIISYYFKQRNDSEEMQCSNNCKINEKKEDKK